MNWKIGQKLVCVDDRWYDGYWRPSEGPTPIKNEIYVYEGPHPLNPSGYILLMEFIWISSIGIRCGWDYRAFREIVDIGDDVEEYIKSKINEPEYA